MKDSKKSLQRKIICICAIWLLLFAAGVLFGSLYVLRTGTTLVPESVMPALSDKDIRLTRRFSGFLFDHVFYLTAVFLFGMTFLGTAIIPATVVLKGMTIGISLSYVLCCESISIYLQKWSLYYLPAAFCVAVFILFSAYAYSVSLNCCSLLLNKGASAVSLKSYGLLFLMSLLILAAAGCLHCVLYLLSAILF